MRGSIGQIFLNVSMVNRIDGLQAIAKKAGIKLQTLNTWNYLIFVNSSRDKLALLVGPTDEAKGLKPIMAYQKMARGQKIDLRAIKEIPRYFDGKSLNYDQALEKAIDTALAKKGTQVIEAVI